MVPAPLPCSDLWPARPCPCPAVGEAPPPADVHAAPTTLEGEEQAQLAAGLAISDFLHQFGRGLGLKPLSFADLERVLAGGCAALCMLCFGHAVHHARCARCALGVLCCHALCALGALLGPSPAPQVSVLHALACYACSANIFSPLPPASPARPLRVPAAATKKGAAEGGDSELGAPALHATYERLLQVNPTPGQPGCSIVNNIAVIVFLFPCCF